MGDERRRRELIRFASLFSALVLALPGALEWLDPNSAVLHAISNGAAAIVCAVLRTLGSNPERAASTVWLGSTNIAIVPQCIGIDTIWMLVAAIIAFPVSFSSRMSAIMLFVPLLAIVNVVRMVTLIYCSIYIPTATEVLHLYVWPTVVVVSALALWWSWATRAMQAPA